MLRVDGQMRCLGVFFICVWGKKVRVIKMGDVQNPEMEERKVDLLDSRNR